MRSVRGLVASALVLLVAASVVLSVTFGLAAGPAAALVTCGPGLVRLPGPDVCIDVNGGTASGTRAAITSPAPLNAPSSVLAAANGVGGTVAENANLAELNGGKRFLTYADRIGKASGIVSGGLIGYEIGGGIAKFACYLGASATCSPKKPSGYAVNADVVLGSPGWIGGQTVTDFYGPVRTYSFSQSLVAGAPAIVNGQYVLNVDFTPYTGGYIAVAGQVYAGVGTASRVSCGSGVVVGGGMEDASSRTGVSGCNGPDGSPVVPDALVMCSPGVPSCTLEAAGTTGVIAYLFPGVKGRPEPDADPVRTFESEATCSGGTKRVATSSSFRESQEILPDLPEPSACPTGEEVTSLTLRQKSAGAPTRVLSDVAVPDPVKVWQADYPACGGGVCRLGLWKFTGTGQASCFAGADCAGWTTDRDSYRCTYGLGAASVFEQAQVVPIGECKVYGPTFKPNQKAAGVVYADPATGDVPETPAVTDPQPTSGPSPEPTPGGAGAPAAGADGGSCFPTGWGVLNPLEWVYKPVKCALQWAFIPSTDVSALIPTITGTITGKAPFGWFGGLGGGVVAAIPTNQCPDWRIKVNGLDENVVCDSSFTAAIRTGRPVFLAMMATLAVWPLIRSIMYGSIPILKVHPTEGK